MARIRVHITAEDLRDKAAPFLAELARTLPKDARVTVIVGRDAAQAASQLSVGWEVEDLPESHRAAFDAIARGIDRPKYLQSELGLRPRRVQELLTDLLDSGLIEKAPTYGHYKVA